MDKTEDNSPRSRIGYMALANAIIKSGIKYNDQTFLQSDWCATLRELVKLGDKDSNRIHINNNVGRMC